MDQLAKSSLKLLLNDNLQPPSYESHPYAMQSVFHSDTQILDDVQNKLYKKIVDSSSTSYWITNKKLEREDFVYSTQALLHVKALKLMRPARRRFISKWSMGCIPTGKNMKRWKFRENLNCPFCNGNNENKEHILRCQHVEALTGWELKCQDFHKEILKIHSSPLLLTAAIIDDMTSWRNRGSYTNDLLMAPRDLDKAIKAQRELGWDLFLDGIIHEYLLDYQQVYFDQLNIDKPQSITTWAPKFIKLLCDFIF